MINIFVIVRYTIWLFIGIIVFITLFLIVKDDNFEKYLKKRFLNESSIEIEREEYYNKFLKVTYIMMGLFGLVEFLNDLLN